MLRIFLVALYSVSQKAVLLQVREWSGKKTNSSRSRQRPHKVKTAQSLSDFKHKLASSLSMPSIGSH